MYWGIDMNLFGFSAEKLQFFILKKQDGYEASGIWPDDIKQVSDDVMETFSGTPPSGMRLGADKKGNPAWVDIPPLSYAELVEQAETKKRYLISEVESETAMLRTKHALGRIKPDEKALLNAWLDYLDELEAVDVSTAPDITWPVKP
ncbi:tail fiber assembly protein [Morganella sp. B601]|uniref:tail fiber assembly protein n=1 Tax=Morganella sp. B601 TaxID=3444315 RepID=UPI003EB76BD4